MNCTTCGTSLDAGVAFCPKCGMPVPVQGSVDQFAPTIAANSIPPTVYGSPPPDYRPSDPYSFPSPPPPPPSKKGHRVPLVMVATVLAALLIIGGVFFIPGVFHKGTTPQNIPTPKPLSQADLTATATVVAGNLTATEVATNPYGGTLVLQSGLTTNSNDLAWDESSGQNGACQFSGSGYVVLNSQPNNINVCTANGTGNYKTFAVEVSMAVNSGDIGGIVFRYDQNKNNGYEFLVGSDGKCILYSFTNGNTTTLINLTSDKVNASSSNLIAVVAIGSTISLYINRQPVKSIDDSSFSTGKFGLAVGSAQGASATYTNFKVWLPAQS